MAMKIHTTLRTEIFLFDTVAVALEMICMTILHGVLDSTQAATQWAAVALGWTVVATVYKSTMSPHDRFYTPWTMLFTFTVVSATCAFSPTKAAFELGNALSVSRAVAYAFVSSLDSYALAVYESRREGYLQRGQMTFFLHGGVLLANSFALLGTALFITMVGQGACFFFMHRRDTSKKSDVLGVCTDDVECGGGGAALAAAPTRSAAGAFAFASMAHGKPKPLLKPPAGGAGIMPPALHQSGGQEQEKADPALEEEFKRALAQTKATTPMHATSGHMQQ
eukprot:620093-Rhodomonas_salina.1